MLAYALGTPPGCVVPFSTLTGSLHVAPWSSLNTLYTWSGHRAGGAEI
jgi:hypothetical protein